MVILVVWIFSSVLPERPGTAVATLRFCCIISVDADNEWLADTAAWPDDTMAVAPEPNQRYV